MMASVTAVVMISTRAPLVTPLGGSGNLWEPLKTSGNLCDSASAGLAFQSPLELPVAF